MENETDELFKYVLLCMLKEDPDSLIQMCIEANNELVKYKKTCKHDCLQADLKQKTNLT